MGQFLGFPQFMVEEAHILRDSGFFNLLKPFEDRGFKIKTHLALIKQGFSSIPPSAAKGSQMVKNDVHDTSNIANVGIYVEQAIRRLKDFRILKHQQALLYLPILNDTLQVISGLVNFKRHLAE